jgi:hypothetical protein
MKIIELYKKYLFFYKIILFLQKSRLRELRFQPVNLLSIHSVFSSTNTLSVSRSSTLRVHLVRSKVCNPLVFAAPRVAYLSFGRRFFAHVFLSSLPVPVIFW